MFWDCRLVIWMRADAMKGSGDLERWLAPFLARLGHKARRRMCPLYVEGLIGPGDRKSVEPMAARLAPGDYDQLHHFISDGVWDETPLEEELALHADGLVGGARAALVVDDTALPKKGSHSAGVAPQYASALGKTANCQTLVSLTLAQNEVPVMISLRLFLPESWTGDAERLIKAGVPEEARAARSKPEIALNEIDRVLALAFRFGLVGADPEYGLSAAFRQGLDARKLTWAVGVPKHQKVYPADVGLVFPVAGRGRPRKRHIPDQLSLSAEEMLAQAKWRRISRRKEPRDRWPLPSPPFACGSPTERRSESMTKACSICPAPKPGWWASAAPRANANTPSPIFLPTSASRGSPPPSRRVGFASRRTSSSRRSWGSIISRVAPGAAYTATL